MCIACVSDAYRMRIGRVSNYCCGPGDRRASPPSGLIGRSQGARGAHAAARFQQERPGADGNVDTLALAAGARRPLGPGPPRPPAHAHACTHTPARPAPLRRGRCQGPTEVARFHRALAKPGVPDWVTAAYRAIGELGPRPGPGGSGILPQRCTPACARRRAVARSARARVRARVRRACARGLPRALARAARAPRARRVRACYTRVERGWPGRSNKNGFKRAVMNAVLTASDATPWCSPFF